MGRGSVGSDAITKPTKYRADHGTMTLHPESSVPTMQITIAGSPPVFLQNGEFYDQNGEPYDFDRIPDGEDWFRQHIAKTANKKILAMHGFLVDGPVPVVGPKADDELVDEDERLNAERLARFSEKDTTGDADLILETIGEGEMTYDAIVKATGLSMHRFKMAVTKLGDELEKIGEGQKGNPYLYRRAMPL